MSRTGLVAFALLALSGCAAHSTLLRWSEQSGADEPRKDPILKVSSQPADPPVALTAKTLPERASAAYIHALSLRASNVADLRKQMATPIRKNDAPTDPLTLDRILSLGVQREDMRPADRLVRTRVQLAPPRCKGQRRYVFTDYQAASTNYDTVNIGTVSLTSQATTSVGLTPTLPFGGGSLSLGNTSTDASTRNIVERPQLSIDVAPESIDVVRTGSEGYDLLGNTLVKLSVRRPLTDLLLGYLAEATLFDEKGESVLAPEKASLKISPADAAIAADLKVCAKLTGTDRTVETGAQYHDEGKQHVHYVPIDLGWQMFTLVGHGELQSTHWFILDDRGGPALEAHGELANDAIVFDSYAAADDFVLWLQKFRVSKIGKTPVGFESGTATLRPITHFDHLTIHPRTDGIESTSATDAAEGCTCDP